MRARRFDAAHDHAHIADAIRGSGSDKAVANAADVSVQTASRWRNGHTFPDGLRLTRLMRWSKHIADTVLRLAGLDDPGLDAKEARADAREARLTQEFHQVLALHGIVTSLGEPPDDQATTDDALDGAQPGPDPGPRMVRGGPHG